MTTVPADVRIVGVGNVDRGDDAIGRLVARRLAADPPAGATVIECPGDAAALVDALSGANRVVIVDAADFAAAPGTVRRLDAAAGPLPLAPAWSSHGLGLAAAIELARRLGRLPARCVVLAVQAGATGAGGPLSAAVAAALPDLEAQVRHEVAAA